MQRKVQLYVQTDVIETQECFCIRFFIDGVEYFFYPNGTGYNDRNIFESSFDISGGETILVWNLRYEDEGYWALWENDYDRIRATLENTENCPIGIWDAGEWRSEVYSLSCTINKNTYQKLELFNDEKMVLNCSVQNIADLQSVFSDYSQSFVVPASAHNNAILEHWYNSEVNGLQDNRLRRKARIEVDLTLVRTGKLQIEKANIKDGVIYSYTLQFFSELTGLKDKVGESSLNSLDLSEYEFEYDLANVSDLVSFDFDQNVSFPLISSRRFWTYNDAGVDDISDSASAMYFTELFPAIKVARLFDKIAEKYGLTFTGDFLTNKRFTNLYLWLKNQEISGSGTIPVLLKNNRQLLDINEDIFVNLEQVYFKDTDVVTINKTVLSSYYYDITINIEVTSVVNSTPYFIEVYKNDILIITVEATNTGIKYADKTLNPYTSNSLGVDTYQFYVKSDNINTVDFNINTLFTYQTDFGSFTDTFFTSTSITFTSVLNINQYLPNLKITEFLKGIFNQFNLTCVPTDIDTYEVIPLDSWYGEGSIYDVSKYTDVKDIEFNRVSLPKAIKFEYEKSESFVNRTFTALAGYEYGQINLPLTFDGGEYAIKLPFENIRFNKFAGTNVQVAYSLKADQIPPENSSQVKEYVPKPILLYKYEEQNTDVDIYMTDGTTTFNLQSYVPFGQDLLYGSGDVSLNFSDDTSSFLNQQMIYNSYSMYYDGYISNLYNPHNRLVSLKCVLPLSLINKLKLNDRLVINNKRYIINDYSIDLTSGECNFKLLNDFRLLNTYGWQDNPETFPPLPIE